MRKKNHSIPQPGATDFAAEDRPRKLGDFTTSFRILPISLLAMVIGVLCAYVALALLRLIGLFTNLFYYGRWNTSLISPANNHLGWYSILVPIAGTSQELPEISKDSFLRFLR